ncbi:MAG TPA: tetratricopeptide repeat protein, partial [Flavobacteriales bacterium]|nr:tetratricopeptide repeat protein [Flavobacteriales bacterium]
LTMASAVNLDSLWGVWNDKTQPDTNRLKAMNKIAFGIIYFQPDSAFYFAQLQYDYAESVNNKKYMANALNTQGASFYLRGDYAKAIDYYTRSLKIYEELGDKNGIAATLNNIGNIYVEQGDYAKAIDYYTKSLKIREEIGDRRGIAMSLGNIGVIYKNQGDFAKAIDYYTKSLKIEEEIGNKKGITSSLGNIGNIYLDQGDYAKAIDYYSRCLKIGEEIGDKKSIASSLGNIGIIYADQGDYTKAIDYFTRSLTIKEELGDKNGIATTLGNIGVIYADQGDYAKAIDYYTRSLKIQEELGDKKGIAISLNNIGAIYQEQGDYAKALEKCTKALSIAQEIGNVEKIKDASNNLWEIHKKLGKHSQALEMHELYIEMCDSINSIENKEAIIQQEYKYKYEKDQALEEAKHQEQMALSAEREKRQQLIAYSAGGGLVMVLLFAFFILNRLQVTRRQKKVIEEQKQKVEEQKQVVEEQKQKVEEQKKDITDSIRYAENIQRALLPTIENLKDALPDGFVLFQPKDIVSGDFYWMQHRNDCVYLAACDCTGHGVPGAFMSMIGSSLLDEAVVEKGISQPNEIFFEVRKGFIHALKQTGKAGQQKDGMDATLIAWDKKKNLQLASAFNPVLIIRNEEITELKPDRQPVGFLTGEQKPFTHHELKLEKGDTVYLFSDGYPDQFGGKKDKKFMMKNFKKLLLSIQDKTMNEQKTILETTMAEWKGDTEQVDDILVMGVRF